MDGSYDAMRMFISPVLMLVATASILMLWRRMKLPHGGGYLVRYGYLASVVFCSLGALSLYFLAFEFIGAIGLPAAGLAFLMGAVMGLCDHISLRRRLDGSRVEPIHISGDRRLLIMAVFGLFLLITIMVLMIFGQILDFISLVIAFISGTAVGSLIEYRWVVSMERRLGEPLVVRHLNGSIATTNDE